MLPLAISFVCRGVRRLPQPLEDANYLDDVKRLAGGARYITSVCTGSLILGAAGLLDGKRAACHWTSRDLLLFFNAIPDEGRVVRDGNIITGGGVTAGIDFAFTVVAEIAGEKVAETLQLALEYAPAPPFDAGRPETAPADVRKTYAGHGGEIHRDTAGPMWSGRPRPCQPAPGAPGRPNNLSVAPSCSP